MTTFKVPLVIKVEASSRAVAESFVNAFMRMGREHLQSCGENEIDNAIKWWAYAEIKARKI